jgi:hypothetical protein
MKSGVPFYHNEGAAPATQVILADRPSCTLITAPQRKGRMVASPLANPAGAEGPHCQDQAVAGTSTVVPSPLCSPRLPSRR